MITFFFQGDFLKCYIIALYMLVYFLRRYIDFIYLIYTEDLSFYCTECSIKSSFYTSVYTLVIF